MKCPKCGKKTWVVDTRLLVEKNAIRRRRACKKCKRRFTTYEEMCIVQNTRKGRKPDQTLFARGKEIEAKNARKEVIRALLKDGGMGRLMDAVEGE